MGIDPIMMAMISRLAKGGGGAQGKPATDNDVIDALIENDLLGALADEDGSILTDEFNNILV